MTSVARTLVSSEKLCTAFESPQGVGCGTTTCASTGRIQNVLSWDECFQCLPPSFVDTLCDILGCSKQNCCRSERGAVVNPELTWFWTPYVELLLGNDVCVDISGSPVSLATDRLSVWRVAGERMAQGGRGPQEPSTSTEQIAAESIGAGLLSFCAVATSLVLHVARQPMLERGQGPTAVVFCATKEQCDDLCAIIDKLGSQLHLTTHNAFGGYPPMPADMRADIVVTTPPLWQTMSSERDVPQGDRLDLFLIEQPGGSVVPQPRLRPYRLSNVAQLLFIDLDSQFRLGYAAHLFSVVAACSVKVPADTTKSSARSEGTKFDYSCFYTALGGLLPGCQLSAVVSGAAGSLCFEKLHRTFVNRPQPARDTASGQGTVTPVYVAYTSCHLLQEGDPSSVKRRRVEMTGESAPTAYPGDDTQLLFVQQALSPAQVVADEHALVDFVAEIEHISQEFLRQFTLNGNAQESEISPTRELERLPCVTVEVIHLCSRDVRASGKRLQATWRRIVGDSRAVYIPTETVLSVQISQHILQRMESTHATRLLLKRLESKLSGQLFDGNLLSCAIIPSRYVHRIRTERTSMIVPGDDLTVLGEHAVRACYKRRGDAATLHTNRSTFAYLSSPCEPSKVPSGGAHEPSDVSAYPTDVATIREECEALVRVTQGNRAGSQPSILKATCFLPPTTNTWKSSDFAPELLRSDSGPFDGANTADESVIQALSHFTTRVIVLRGFPLPAHQFCSKPMEGTPSAAQLILEECSQYGKVQSYHIHEQRTAANDATSDGTEHQSQGDSEKDSIRLSLFVEFATAEAALVAARQFKLRFEAPPDPNVAHETTSPTVAVGLFRLDTYLQGVLQDLKGTMNTSEDSSDDDMLDFVGSFSLLDEQ